MMQKWEQVAERFKAQGIIAIYGGGAKAKGHGFWLVCDGPLETGTGALANDGANTGNPYFWTMADAERLLAQIEGERARVLKIIWRETHADYRGCIEGVRTILVNRGGSCLVGLGDLTDEEIIDKYGYYSRRLARDAQLNAMVQR
jgi:hypothetical protein